MKKLCAFLAVVLSLAFAGLTLAQDKPAAKADKPAAEAAKDAKPAAEPEKKEEAKPAPTPNKGDVAWMLTSTALVLMMSVPALALFYGGMVRSKNALSMLMQVFVVFSLVTVLWCIYGYSLAFTEGNRFFGGFDRLFLKDDTRNPSLSFKDRPVALALARALELGLDTLACASTGNLAGAVAAAAARNGLRAFVFVPATTDEGKIAGAAAYGATVVRVRGTYDQVNRLCARLADEERWGFVNFALQSSSTPKLHQK